MYFPLFYLSLCFASFFLSAFPSIHLFVSSSLPLPLILYYLLSRHCPHQHPFFSLIFYFLFLIFFFRYFVFLFFSLSCITHTLRFFPPLILYPFIIFFLSSFIFSCSSFLVILSSSFFLYLALLTPSTFSLFLFFLPFYFRVILFRQFAIMFQKFPRFPPHDPSFLTSIPVLNSFLTIPSCSSCIFPLSPHYQHATPSFLCFMYRYLSFLVILPVPFNFSMLLFLFCSQQPPFLFAVTFRESFLIPNLVSSHTDNHALSLRLSASLYIKRPLSSTCILLSSLCLKNTDAITSPDRQRGVEET